MLEYLIQLDKELFLVLNGLHSPFFDTIMVLISSKWIWFPLYAVLIGLIIRSEKKRSWWAILFLVLTVALSDLISVHLFKDVFERLRPSHDLSLEGLVHLVNNHKGGKFGFVSSHAANAFSMAIFFAFFFRNKAFTYFIVSWATIVSYSRIYLGVHFPADIICGALLGTFIGVTTFYLYRRLYLKRYPNNKAATTMGSHMKIASDIDIGHKNQ